MMTGAGKATMSELLFVSQATLEAWMEADKVRFEDNLLTLLADQATYELAPAVRILGLLDGDDSAGLVGQVQTVAELAAINAEQYRDSVILGDTAYQCEEGFVGTRQGGANRLVQAPESSPDRERSDMDLLTEFMLKNL
jgi:hypothetical protein